MLMAHDLARSLLLHARRLLLCIPFLLCVYLVPIIHRGRMLWCGAAGLCARVRACAGAAESLHTYIRSCCGVWRVRVCII